MDEVTSVGDATFRRKSRQVFMDRMECAGAGVVTHAVGQVRPLCQAGAVLEAERLTYYDDVKEAIDHHYRNMGSTEKD